MITIKESTAKELDNVKALWADGDVMKFVGFPDGLLQTDDEMKVWLDWIESERPKVNHYSIFDGSVYCGETFYSIDSKHGNSASMDIKLFGFARGKGIAAKALSYGTLGPLAGYRSGGITIVNFGIRKGKQKRRMCGNHKLAM